MNTAALPQESDSEDQWVRFTVPSTHSSSILHSRDHTFDNLLPGATYHVQVTATNEFGESDVNETFAFSTLLLGKFTMLLRDNDVQTPAILVTQR